MKKKLLWRTADSRLRPLAMLRLYDLMKMSSLAHSESPKRGPFQQPVGLRHGQGILPKGFWAVPQRDDVFPIRNSPCSRALSAQQCDLDKVSGGSLEEAVAKVQFLVWLGLEGVGAASGG